MKKTKLLAVISGAILSMGILSGFSPSEKVGVSSKQVFTEINKISLEEFTAKITDWDSEYTYAVNPQTGENYVIDNMDVHKKYKIGSLVNVNYLGDGLPMKVTDFKGK